MNTTSNKRLLALDVMLGITIAGMILVNNPGSWGTCIRSPKTCPIGNWLTPTDLVFPFFMFIMGISTYISLKKYNFTLILGCPENNQKNHCYFPYRNSPQLVCLTVLHPQSSPI